MLNNYIKIIKGFIATLVISLVSMGTANAQLEDVGEILRGGAGDANIYLSEFLSPFANGFGAGLNTGWFTTANSHASLGFELNLNASIAMVPSSDLSMDINSLNFSEMQLQQGSDPIAPTISGDQNSNTVLEIYGEYEDQNQNTHEIKLTEFETPGGVGFEYVPAPMAQLTVGVIKDTDVSLRFVPTTELGDFGELGLFGFGVKHGVNQWLPGGSVLPVDLSVQFGYTNFNMSTSFEVNPEVPEGGNAEIENTFPASTWEGQGLEMETSSYTINAIVGKKLPIIAVYGGIGIEGSTTTLTTPGSYPLTSIHPDYPQSSSQSKIIEKIDSPIDIEIEGSNNFRAFAGFRVKLAVIQLFANYTLSEYSSANAGIGLTFR